MGLFEKTAGADPSGERNNPKPGKYWVLVNSAAKGVNNNPRGGHQGKEYMKVLTVVVRAFDGAGCKAHGVNAQGQPNPLCGKGHAPGDPCDFIFQDGILGNENRLKSFVMRATETEDKNAITTEALNMMVSNVQPLRDYILEVFTAPEAIKTGKEKWIHGSQVERRVWAEEVKSVFDSLPDAAKAELTREGRLDRMLAKEAEEKAAKARRLAGVAK